MSSSRAIRLIEEPSTFANARAAEKAASIQRNALAANIVAQHSRNVADCVELLAMLGLDLSEISVTDGITPGLRGEDSF